MLSKKIGNIPTRPRHVIRGSSTQTAAVPMARRSIIPAGRYVSKITSITPTKTSAGAEAVEVVYGLTDAHGKQLKMREVIPINSFPYTRFSDAMIAAGLSNGGDILDAVGVEEKITIEYSDPHGLGHISKRTPLGSASINADQPDDLEAARYVADEEFDDFLSEDDDED